MGMVSIVADILKFPWPLYPKYKQTFNLGLRYDIPALIQDCAFVVNLPPNNKYELQGVVFSSTGYKDGDSFSIYRNNDILLNRIYTKELGQRFPIRPVRKIDPANDAVTFIFHNNTGTSKVIWVDLDLTAQKIVLTTDSLPEQPVSPLEYFVATSGQVGYLVPSEINTDYWPKEELVINGTLIRPPFWNGRNDLLSVYGNSASMLSQITDYRIYLYKLVNDVRNNFNTPLFNESWANFKVAARQPYTAPNTGLGLDLLTDNQLAEIYLSQLLKTPVCIFPSEANLIEGSRIDLIRQFLKPSHMFVFDWIDFNEVMEDEGVGGFAVDPAGASMDPAIWQPLREIKSYINIEPTALNLSIDYANKVKPKEYYFPAGATSWYDAHYHSMDAEADPLSAYDLDISDGTVNVAEIFIHEQGHAIDFYVRDRTGATISQNPNWLAIAGWESDYFDKYTYGSSPFLNVTDYISNLGSNPEHEPPVTPYGCSHPLEDFAETYAMYCCNPTLLAAVYPRRYAFMEMYVKNLAP